MDINKVHDFLKERLKASRFTDRNNDRFYGKDYSMRVTQSHIDDVKKYGYSIVTWHSCNQGLGFTFDENLVANYNDRIDRRIDKGTITHIF